MLSLFSQPLYSIVLNEKSNSLLPSYTLLEEQEFARLLCYSTVQENANLNFVVFEFNVPRTKSRTKHI